MGKGWKTLIGMDRFGRMLQIVARYLKFLNESDRTYKHCFKRFGDASADIVSSKHHGGQKSSNVAEEYIDESLNNNVEMANEIFDNPVSTTIENY